MNQHTLKAIFLAMTYTARKEGIELDQKFYDLEDSINEHTDISVTDMVDNMQNVYDLIEGESHES